MDVHFTDSCIVGVNAVYFQHGSKMILMSVETPDHMFCWVTEKPTL